MCDENGNAEQTNAAVIVETNAHDGDHVGLGARVRASPQFPASSEAPGCNSNQTVNGHYKGNVPLSKMAVFKDSSWLQLEVCRDFQRGQCGRSSQECKFAHPMAHIEIQNSRVISCYDSVKNRCNRPACKFFHPPPHLKDQVLINGRNNFMLKNLLIAQMTASNGAIPSFPVSLSNLGTYGPYATVLPAPGAQVIGGGLPAYPFVPNQLNATAIYPNVMVAQSPEVYGTTAGVLPAATSPLGNLDQGQKLMNFRVEMMPGSANKRVTTDKTGAPMFQSVTNQINANSQYQLPFLPAYSPFPPAYFPVAFAGPAPTIPKV